MAYCVKCGAKVEDGIQICPECGSEIPGAAGYGYGTEHESGAGQEQYQYQYQNQTQTQGQTYTQGGYQGKEYFNAEDVRRNKTMGVLSYIGILVLIPILAGDRRSEYVKFHINQGFSLFILSKIIDLLSGNWVWGLHSLIDFSGRWFSEIFDILDLACFILMIVGIVSACRGEKKEMPVIGQIKIWK